MVDGIVDSKCLVALLAIVFPCFVRAIPWQGNTYNYIYYNHYVCVAVFSAIHSEFIVLWHKLTITTIEQRQTVLMTRLMCKTVTSYAIKNKTKKKTNNDPTWDNRTWDKRMIYTMHMHWPFYTVHKPMTSRVLALAMNSYRNFWKLQNITSRFNH